MELQRHIFCCHAFVHFQVDIKTCVKYILWYFFLLCGGSPKHNTHLLLPQPPLLCFTTIVPYESKSFLTPGLVEKRQSSGGETCGYWGQHLILEANSSMVCVVRDPRQRPEVNRSNREPPWCVPERVGIRRGSCAVFLSLWAVSVSAGEAAASHSVAQYTRTFSMVQWWKATCSSTARHPFVYSLRKVKALAGLLHHSCDVGTQTEVAAAPEGPWELKTLRAVSPEGQREGK